MLNATRRGAGAPLLLIHGLGGSLASWTPVLPALAARRKVVAVDLPGHGASPAAGDSGTFAGLTDAVQAYVESEGLRGVDVVRSSMGARLVLELARRGAVGTTVALNPGGFWRGWERTYFRLTMGLSVRLLRALRPALPALAGAAASRTVLLAQLSARPWALDGGFVASELESLIRTPTFDALVRDLATGPEQRGLAGEGTRVVVGWGRQDRLCLPRQALRMQQALPSARLHWFDRCGHFPMWDRPEATVKLILAATEP